MFAPHDQTIFFTFLCFRLSISISPIFNHFNSAVFFPETRLFYVVVSLPKTLKYFFVMNKFD